MALPWKQILANVPWKDVLGNAPKIADGAKNLWKTMGRRGDAAGNEATADPALPAGADHATRLAALEAAQQQLHAQILASGELLQALSEQNARLVAQIEIQRRRARRQAWLLAATALAAGLALLLIRQPQLLEFLA